MSQIFRQMASKTSRAVGSPASFVTAIGFILVWLISGPIFNYSNTWQLVINTATTIITFLMVFLIQNTQNRDSVAVHIKLDELLRGVKGARTGLVDVEEMTDDDLQVLQKEFQELHQKYNREYQRRHTKASDKPA